ncbi:unannotated protein [freshwater metagenome]|uniref:Unannotated protein n=1 Tax=freshwater metagenome TaxID=449393 RepID=A0A6J6J3C2_9ZZZZ
MLVGQRSDCFFRTEPLEGKDLVVGNKFRFGFGDGVDLGRPIVHNLWFAIGWLNVMDRAERRSEVYPQAGLFENFPDSGVGQCLTWVDFALGN